MGGKLHLDPGVHASESVAAANLFDLPPPEWSGAKAQLLSKSMADYLLRWMRSVVMGHCHHCIYDGEFYRGRCSG